LAFLGEHSPDFVPTQLKSLIQQQTEHDNQEYESKKVSDVKSTPATASSPTAAVATPTAAVATPTAAVATPTAAVATSKEPEIAPAAVAAPPTAPVTKEDASAKEATHKEAAADDQKTKKLSRQEKRASEREAERQLKREESKSKTNTATPKPKSKKKSNDPASAAFEDLFSSPTMKKFAAVAQETGLGSPGMKIDAKAANPIDEKEMKGMMAELGSTFEKFSRTLDSNGKPIRESDRIRRSRHITEAFEAVTKRKMGPNSDPSSILAQERAKREAEANPVSKEEKEKQEKAQIVSYFKPLWEAFSNDLYENRAKKYAEKYAFCKSLKVEMDKMYEDIKKDQLTDFYLDHVTKFYADHKSSLVKANGDLKRDLSVFLPVTNPTTGVREWKHPLFETVRTDLLIKTLSTKDLDRVWLRLEDIAQFMTIYAPLSTSQTLGGLNKVIQSLLLKAHSTKTSPTKNNEGTLYGMLLDFAKPDNIANLQESATKVVNSGNVDEAMELFLRSAPKDVTRKYGVFEDDSSDGKEYLSKMAQGILKMRSVPTEPDMQGSASADGSASVGSASAVASVGSTSPASGATSASPAAGSGVTAALPDRETTIDPSKENEKRPPLQMFGVPSADDGIGAGGGRGRGRGRGGGRGGRVRGARFTRVAASSSTQDTVD